MSLHIRPCRNCGASCDGDVCDSRCARELDEARDFAAGLGTDRQCGNCGEVPSEDDIPTCEQCGERFCAPCRKDMGCDECGPWNRKLERNADGLWQERH